MYHTRPEVTFRTKPSNPGWRHIFGTLFIAPVAIVAVELFDCMYCSRGQ